MYTPHTVTIYNSYQNPLTLLQEENATILEGVFLDSAQATGIEKTGLSDADSVTLFIPFKVAARDGTTGNAKQYISPKAYYALSDKSGYWTIDTGGKTSGVGCYFVKGTVISTEGYSAVRKQYDDVYDVTTVDVRDFGSEDMRHFQVGGR